RCFGGIFSVGKPRSRLRSFFFGVLALGWIGALVLLGYARQPFAFFWTAVLYPVAVLPAFGLGKAGRGGNIAYAVSVAGWLGGIWLFQVILEHCQFLRLVHYLGDEGWSVRSDLRFQFVSHWLGLAGNGWGVILLFALLLIATGYIGSAAYLARLAGLPAKRLFTPGVRMLWGFALLAVVVTSCLAWSARNYCAKIEAELTHRFGKPLTAVALADFCREGRTPDPAFWEKIRQSCLKLHPGNLEYHSYEYFRFIIASPETRKLLLQPDHPDWNELIEAFSTPSPPSPHTDLREDKIYFRTDENHAVIILAALGTFAVEEALANRRIDTALRIVRALRNADMIRLRPLNRVDAGDFIRFENTRLNWLERLLESDRLSVGQSADQAIELDAEIEQLTELKQNVRYMTAVTYLHYRRRGDDGHYMTSGRKPPFSPFPTRLFGYLLPSLRWREYHDRTAVLLSITDFAPAGRQHRPELIYLANMEKKIHALEMRCRVLALLFRQYPARELPPGVTLPPGFRYRTGDCKIIESSIEADPAPRNSHRRFKAPWHRKTIPALQIWSVGPNGKDENGLGDDVRVILRLEK
ncbi:MAG: hypothetical protein AB7F32_08040, partial [Victivallaceae bacterium]